MTAISAGKIRILVLLTAKELASEAAKRSDPGLGETGAVALMRVAGVRGAHSNAGSHAFNARKADRAIVLRYKERAR